MTNEDRAREALRDHSLPEDDVRLVACLAAAIAAAEERGAKWMREAAVARRLEIRCAEDVRTLLDPAAVCAERRKRLTMARGCPRCGCWLCADGVHCPLCWMDAL